MKSVNYLHFESQQEYDRRPLRDKYTAEIITIGNKIVKNRHGPVGNIVPAKDKLTQITEIVDGWCLNQIGSNSAAYKYMLQIYNVLHDKTI